MHGVRAACMRSDAHQTKSNCSTQQSQMAPVPPQPPTIPAPPSVLPTPSPPPLEPSPLHSTTLADSAAGQDQAHLQHGEMSDKRIVSNEAVRAGWAQKQSVSAISFFKNWKRRYLTLRKLSIEWSATEFGPRKGVLYLHSAHLRASSVQPSNGLDGGGSLSIIEHTGRELVLHFPTEAELQDWRASLVDKCAVATS